MRTRTIEPNGATLLLGLALVFGTVGGAAAQPSDPLERVHEGQHVWITSNDGGRYEGRVVGIDTSGVDLSADGLRRSLPLNDIRRIETRDSLKNGAIIGGLIGGASMACLVTWAIQLGDEGQGVSRDDIFAAIRLTALAAAGGALAGAGIDRAIDGRRTLYVAPGARVGVAIRPSLSPAAAGAVVTLAW